MSYSIKEAADILTVSEITLRRIITKGNIGYHKIGKMYRLTEEDISSYIRSQRKSKNGNTEPELTLPKINLSCEIIRRIEKETVGLDHGIVKFTLHIVKGKPIRYTLSHEQSVMWDSEDEEESYQPDNKREPGRVEKE